MNRLESAAAIDFSRFGALRAARDADHPQALRAVADEFEAMFVELMLKSAREADLGDDLLGSSELDGYREMLDGELALSMARTQDFGFGAMLARQFGQQLDGDAERVPAPAPHMREVPLQGGLAWQAPTTATPAAAGDKQAFLRELAPHAASAAQRLGVEPRALLAQAALESGWGRHVIRAADGQSSHNYFGIKAGREWPGARVRVPTTEFLGGRAVNVMAEFRTYPDAASAFSDYAEFIAANPRYHAVRDAAPHDFARELEAAGYATDPAYASKIMAILSGDGWDSLNTTPRRQ
jgi:flagellar protein FlgJ